MIVDDHALFCDSLATLLEASGTKVVGVANGGRDAIEQIATAEPDVVLLDIAMPGMSGIDVLREIKAQRPNLKVVMLTMSDREADIMDAINGGADGYILKTATSEEFNLLLGKVLTGRAALSPEIGMRIFERFGDITGGSPVRGTGLAELSERERQVLDLLRTGLTNKEIATRMHLTESTVKYHVSNMLSKLGLRNRVEAAAFAGTI